MHADRAAAPPRAPISSKAICRASAKARDAILLALMGSPDTRQVDGLGGAHPLTCKVAIVRRSSEPGVDIDFLFAQVMPDKDMVDTTPELRQHPRRHRPVRDRARPDRGAGRA